MTNKIFKNIDYSKANLQNKEELLIGLLLESEKHITYGDSNLTNNQPQEELVDLFESVSDLKYNHTMFSEFINTPDSIEYVGNKYAYFNDVVSLLENQIPRESLLKSDATFKNFNRQITTYLSKLDKINDFDKLDAYDNTILKTKILARQPIYIKGFDILNFEPIMDKLDIKELISIVYNKSDKELYFVTNNTIVAYIIATNEFKNIKVSNLNKDNYLYFIKEEINQNIIELYKLVEFKYTDNLYFDKQRYTAIEQIKKSRTINSIFKR